MLIPSHPYCTSTTHYSYEEARVLVSSTASPSSSLDGTAVQCTWFRHSKPTVSQFLRRALSSLLLAVELALLGGASICDSDFQQAYLQS